jgi:hypothetical protein
MVRFAFENLFENKAIYREKFIYVVRLEKVQTTALNAGG